MMMSDLPLEASKLTKEGLSCYIEKNFIKTISSLVELYFCGPIIVVFCFTIFGI